MDCGTTTSTLTINTKKRRLIHGITLPIPLLDFDGNFIPDSELPCCYETDDDEKQYNND